MSPEQIAQHLGISLNEVQTQMIIDDRQQLPEKERLRRVRQRDQIEPLAEKILSLHSQDLLSVKAIAEEVGRPPQAVESWLRQKGELKNAPLLKRLRDQRETGLHWDAIRGSLLRTRSIAMTASELGLRKEIVQIAVNRGVVPDHAVLFGVDRSVAKQYTEEDILDFLRSAAEWRSGTLTTTAYDEYAQRFPARADGLRTPTKQTPINRFGGWGAALRRAGLPANPPGGPEKQFDYHDALRAMTECWRECGHAPTVQEYERWNVGKSQWPSSATIRKLIDGGWPGLRLQAWQVIHQIVLDQDEDVAILPKPVLEDLKSEMPKNEMLVDYAYGSEEREVAPGELYGASRYSELERAVQSHGRIQDSLARLGELCGLSPRSPGSDTPLFDLCLQVQDDLLLLIEVKSATEKNAELQMRIALGQVLLYQHQMEALGFRAKPCIAIELEPSDPWKAILNRLGVSLLIEESLENDLREVLSTC